MKLNLFIFLMFFLLVPFLDAAEIIGKAVKIFDGDSFIVLDELDQAEFGIRIQGIDAPEHDQPFFAFAKKNLEDLLNGKKFEFVFAKSTLMAEFSAMFTLRIKISL